jgi:predicted nucleic acid-binding protein
MAKIKLLIGTDIFIDALKEIKPAKELLRSKELILYCSILTRKELLSKKGLSRVRKTEDSEYAIKDQSSKDR